MKIMKLVEQLSIKSFVVFMTFEKLYLSKKGPIFDG